MCSTVSAASLVVAETVTTVMIQRQVAIAPFHAGTAELKQIGTTRGDRLDVYAACGCQGLQRMRRLVHGFEPRRAQRRESLAVLGVGATPGDPLQIERLNQLGQDLVLHVGSQVQGVDPGLNGRPEEGQGGLPLDRQARRLGEVFAGARGQVGRVGEARPHTRPRSGRSPAPPVARVRSRGHKGDRGCPVHGSVHGPACVVPGPGSVRVRFVPGQSQRLQSGPLRPWVGRADGEPARDTRARRPMWPPVTPRPPRRRPRPV